jgi:HTH-type transcriptional regulator / antitoxin MqsA
MMNTPERCPLCGEGHVTRHSEDVEQTCGNHRAMVPMHFRRCDHCGSDFAGAEESLLNKRAMMQLRKRVEGLLSGARIAEIRAKYGMTQAQAARLLGGGPVAFSKYENDDVAQAASMDRLLRLIDANDSAFWTLVDQQGMRAEFMRTSTQAQRSSEGHYRIESQRPSPVYAPKEFREMAPRIEKTRKAGTP